MIICFIGCVRISNILLRLQRCGPVVNDSKIHILDCTRTLEEQTDGAQNHINQGLEVAYVV